MMILSSDLFCSELDRLHLVELQMAPGLPEVERILHRKPAFRRPPQRLRKPQSHFRADATLAGYDAIERRRGDRQFLCECPDADTKRLKINGANKLSRVGGTSLSVVNLD